MAENFFSFTREVAKLKAAFEESVKDSQGSDETEGLEEHPPNLEVDEDVDDGIDHLLVDDEIMEQVATASKGISKEDIDKIAKIFARSSMAKNEGGKVVLSSGKRKAVPAVSAKRDKK